MLHRYVKLFMLAGLSLFLISGQGCSSMKWFHSGNDELSESEVGGRDSSFLSREGGIDGYRGGSFGDTPSLGRQGTLDDPEGGALRGFSPVVGDRVAGEERLSRSHMGMMLQPVDRADKKYAELRQEEAAAIKAGLIDVFYGYDRWTLQEEGMSALSHDAQWLKENPKAVLKISGHCDERGSHDYNLILGEKRAKAARNHLIELGVNSKQVAIVSYGKDRPFCSESDERCYQQNRRGHMLLRMK